MLDKHEDAISSLIETNDQIFKYHLDRFKYASRFNNEDLNKHREACMDILISLNERLRTSAITGTAEVGIKPN